MQALRSLGIGSYGFGLGAEGAEVVLLSISHDPSSPPLATFGDASLGARARRSLLCDGIHVVLGSRCLSQIRPAIVRIFAVPVVEFSRRLFSGHQFPNDAVSQIGMPIKLNNDVAVASMGLADFPSHPERRRLPLFPAQFASLGVVGKALLKVAEIRQRVGDSHGFLPRKVVVRAAPAFARWCGPHLAVIGAR